MKAEDFSYYQGMEAAIYNEIDEAEALSYQNEKDNSFVRKGLKETIAELEKSGFTPVAYACGERSGKSKDGKGSFGTVLVIEDKDQNRFYVHLPEWYMHDWRCDMRNLKYRLLGAPFMIVSEKGYNRYFSGYDDSGKPLFSDKRSGKSYQDYDAADRERDRIVKADPSAGCFIYAMNRNV